MPPAGLADGERMVLYAHSPGIVKQLIIPPSFLDRFQDIEIRTDLVDMQVLLLYCCCTLAASQLYHVCVLLLLLFAVVVLLVPCCCECSSLVIENCAAEGQCEGDTHNKACGPPRISTT